MKVVCNACNNWLNPDGTTAVCEECGGKGWVEQPDVPNPFKGVDMVVKEKDQTVCAVIDVEKMVLEEGMKIVGDYGWKDGRHLVDVEMTAKQLERFLLLSKEGSHEEPQEKEQPPWQESIDANVWAEEFCKTFNKLYKNAPILDPGWVMGWFANAMMARHDFDFRGHPEPTPCEAPASQEVPISKQTTRAVCCNYFRVEVGDMIEEYGFTNDGDFLDFMRSKYPYVCFQGRAGMGEPIEKIPTPANKDFTAEYWNPTEAIYAFMCWLTTRKQSVTLGAYHDSGVAVTLIKEFKERHHLPECRKEWEEAIIPVVLDPVIRKDASGKDVEVRGLEGLVSQGRAFQQGKDVPTSH